ncbi:hypothetical protein ACFL1H_03270 [Nanoarchaeota archaeon]
MKFVILGAMEEEVAEFKDYKDVYVACTGVGKTNAAIVAQKMIYQHDPDYIFFVGVAGALTNSLNVGDIVVGESAIDIDMDVRLWDSRYKIGEIPFSGDRIFHSDLFIVDLLKNLQKGYIATGSKFLDSNAKRELVDRIDDFKFDNKVPNVYDMESVAVLQTAQYNNVKCLVLRTISDNLNGGASDFNNFMKEAVLGYKPIVDNLIYKLECLG